MYKKTPALFQFLAGYFNEDWNCDHETEDDVVRSFIADSSMKTLGQTKMELQRILDELKSDEQIQHFLFEEISCSYYYPYAWPSGRAWLEHILRML